MNELEITRTSVARRVAQRRVRVAALGAALALVVPRAAGAGAESPKFCSQTARALLEGCRAEARDDASVARARCINVEDADERSECLGDAKSSRVEDFKACREQLFWRFDACALLGEERYDPQYSPTDFETDFSDLQHANPYFPLAVGNTWTFEGDGELNTLEVLDETKLIDGVTNVVVRDQVFQEGDLVEDTDDWFAQHVDGTVWYFGEEVKDYESFDGDVPRLPELVSIDGSFKAGRDGDKAGIIFLASPAAGAVYLEEFSLGNAEDVTEILSASYGFGDDPVLDQLVPEELAELLCNDDCVVTRNFSLLEPGVEARKYYAPGIGFFLETVPDSGEVLQLIDCNLDPRCALLPPG